MAVYHRTQRLQIFGDKPEIEKLYGNRYRMVVRCVAANGTKAWYNANKAQIFADFGTLYSAQMSVDGIDARTGEAYPDMVLVENKAYIYGRSEEYLVEFTYETLTDSFVQETEDKVDFDLNGLKRLTRTIIAKDTVAYSSVVGTTTIVGSSPLLTLAQVSEDQLEASQDGFKRIQEVWLESGILNVQRRSESEGVYRVTTTFLGEEGTVVGPIVARVEDNYEGFKTTTVVSMQDAGGSSLVSGGSQPVASHSNLSEFSYPGVVTISSETLAGLGGTYTFRAKDFSLKPPVVARVEATIKVSFKPTSAISYTGTDGLWNPTTWAEGFSRGIGWNYSPFSISRGFRGYRIDSNATNSYSGYGIPGTANIFDMISGNRIFGNTTYSIEVSGGPENPDGNQYTLDYSVSLAFEDVDGTPYYKHKEIVATIPTQ